MVLFRLGGPLSPVGLERLLDRSGDVFMHSASFVDVGSSFFACSPGAAVVPSTQAPCHVRRSELKTRDVYQECAKLALALPASEFSCYLENGLDQEGFFQPSTVGLGPTPVGKAQ